MGASFPSDDVLGVDKRKGKSTPRPSHCSHDALRQLVSRWRKSANAMTSDVVATAWYEAADDLCELLNAMQDRDIEAIPPGLCRRSG